MRGAAPRQRSRQAPSCANSENRNTLISIITPALSLPGVTKKDRDVSDHLKSQVQRLIKWSKDRRQAGQQNPFVLLPPDQMRQCNRQMVCLPGQEGLSNAHE